jgi:V8-like Glu-specific endopeptidase
MLASAVGDPRKYPYSACGKLFFTQGNGDFMGSAAVVSPNVILTAGHCVHQGAGGGWSTNVAFYPAYPLLGKQFAYHTLAAWTAWTGNSDRKFDYGLIWVDDNIGAQVGWLGLLWNASTAGRTWNAVAYPADPSPPFPSDGGKMYETRGAYVASDTAGTIGLDHDDMKHGSSGGNWITDFNGAPNYSNGLQSFHTSMPNIEYGPYFDDSVKKLLDWITDPANRH